MTSMPLNQHLIAMAKATLAFSMAPFISPLSFLLILILMELLKQTEPRAASLSIFLSVPFP